jgi:23S rRNA pseudouridine2457 synthase
LLLMARIVLLNKPYGFLSQFTPEGRWRGLAELLSVPGFQVAGRLDADSEGLLLLTDDGGLQAKIAEPRHKLPKTYWVQVEGEPTDEALDQLRRGVRYADFTTRPASVRRMEESELAALWPRDPPIRFRKSVPTSWIEIRISEGKNRQIRRMTAHVGYPTLRLIRYAIGSSTVDGLVPGESRMLTGCYADLAPGTIAEPPVVQRDKRNRR